MPGVLLAVIVLPHLFNRVNEEIRRRVERRFADHYPNFKVSIRSAERVEGVGIELRGISLSGREGIAATDRAARDDAPAVFIERVTLVCTTNLAELLCPDVDISRIIIHRPTLCLMRRQDGSWSTADLLPLPKFSDRQPEVVVEGGVVEIVDEQKNPTSTYTLRDVDLRLAAPEGPQNQFPASDVAASTSSAVPRHTATGHTETRQLSGSLTGDHLRRIEFTGRLDAGTSNWDIGGVIDELELSPELIASLPSHAAERLRKTLGAFRGRGRFNFRVQGDGVRPESMRFQLCGDVDQGRFDDRRLPYPLTNISATVCCNNDGFSVQNLFAQSGKTTLRFSGKMAGFSADSPWQLEAEIENLKLERALRASLPSKLQAVWDKYNPAGELQRVKLRLQADSSGFRRELADIFVDCGDVSFSYAKFPYEIEHSHGNIQLSRGVSKTVLRGYSAGEAIEMRGEVIDPLARLYSDVPRAGWCEIRAARVPLDGKLFAAVGRFDARLRTSLERFQPRGTVGCYARIWRDRPGDEPLRHLIIALDGCAIKFEKFPYPIRDIRGTMERFADGSWELRSLEGCNDTARINCNGSLSVTDRGRLLSLVLSGADVPLDKQLRDALPPRMQRVWDDSKPRGIVDLENIKIDWLADEKTLDLSLECLPLGDTVSMEPKMFPYRLEKIEGRMVYHNGRVELEGFKARHGPLELRTCGYCEFPQEAGWHFHFDNVNVDRLMLDRELVQALPGRMRRAVLELNPSGPMYLQDGSLDLLSSGAAGDPVRAAWRISVGFHQCSADCGVRLHNMHGRVRLAGSFDGAHYRSQGELDIDSLMYKNIQFTQVRGPLQINDDNIWLGYTTRTASQAAAVAASRCLSAKVFGGTIEGNCRVTLDGGPRYDLHARLDGADLARCAQQTMPGRHRLQGEVDAVFSLRGAGRSLNTLQGRGEIHLSKADIYELPLMIALLKILSVREPDTNAFSESYMRFRIGGNHIYFDPINFSGDAISLRGSGEMDFQSNVKLQFYTVVGRDKWQVPILSPVLGGASQQALVINVNGPLQNPRTTREILPLAKKALQQLQADLRGMGILGDPAAADPAPAGLPAARPRTTPGQSSQGRQPIQPSLIK